MVTVTVFLNQNERNSFIRGYTPGDPMTEAFTYETDSTNPLEEAYWLFNVGDDPDMTGGKPDARAVAYRALRHRSLSKGDVVVYDGRAFSCESAGFKALDRPAPLLLGQSTSA